MATARHHWGFGEGEGGEGGETERKGKGDESRREQGRGGWKRDLDLCGEDGADSVSIGVTVLLAVMESATPPTLLDH